MLAEINKRVLSQCVCKEGIVRDDASLGDNAGASCPVEVVLWLWTDELTIEGTGNIDQHLTRA